MPIFEMTFEFDLPRKNMWPGRPLDHFSYPGYSDDKHTHYQTPALTPNLHSYNCEEYS